MKIRSGFVSNSSSSSFVVKPDITTSDLALIMMNVIKEDYKDREWMQSGDFIKVFDKALEWLYANPNYNDPIMLPWSINDETFIWTTKDGIQVATCNNQNWYDYIEYDYDDEYPCGNSWRDIEAINLEDFKITTKNRYYKEKYNIISL